MSDGTANTGTDNLIGYVVDVLKHAKENRQALLEPKWTKCYAAANADPEFNTDTWKKKEQPDTSKKKKGWKSKTYFDATRQKITTAHSLTTDTLFRGGRLPFMLDPDERSSMVRQALEQRAAMVAQAEAQGQTVSDAEIMDDLQQAVEANEDLITTETEETGVIREIGLTIMTGATYGEMVCKSFVTSYDETWYEMPYPGVMVPTTKTTDTKSVEAVSVWNFWRDLEAKTLESADYMFHRALTNESDLRNMLGQGGVVIDSAVRRILTNAAGKQSTTTQTTDNTQPPGERGIAYRRRPLELYEGWLWVPVRLADDFEKENQLAGVEVVSATPQDAAIPEATPGGPVPSETEAAAVVEAPALPDDSARVYIFCQFVDQEIIAYRRDPGKHPFCYEPWTAIIDGIGGRGLAEALEHIQLVLNGAIRSFENNVKLLANFIVAARRDKMLNKPEDVIDEGGVIELDAECDDVRQALQQVVFQDITAPLTKAIEMFLGFADYASNLPRAEQGQQGDNPQTAFELQQRLDRSGKYLAGVIRNIDRIIRWTVQEMYDYNSQNPDLDIPKLPCVVKALGFSSFENRYLRVQKLMQMLTMALQSEQLLGLTDIRWLWEEIGKGQDLEVDQYIKSAAERQAEVQQQSGKGDAQAAALAAKADKDVADAEKKRTDAGVEVARLQLDAAKPAELGGAIMERPGTMMKEQAAGVVPIQ